MCSMYSDMGTFKEMQFFSRHKLLAEWVLKLVLVQIRDDRNSYLELSTSKVWRLRARLSLFSLYYFATICSHFFDHGKEELHVKVNFHWKSFYSSSLLSSSSSSSLSLLSSLTSSASLLLSLSLSLPLSFS